MPHYILITGYRQQLAKAIAKLDIPYSIITEKPIKTPPPGVDEVLIIPFANFSTEQDLQGLQLKHVPTHVIAGTEAGVFPAALLRRFYKTKGSDPF